MSTLPFSIYLLKGNYHNESAHIRDATTLTRYDVGVPGATYSRLYLRRNPSRLPDWREIFPTLDWQRYRVNGFAGILVLEVDGRRFALTAGSGRHHLSPFALEENFGFKVVINSAEPTQIRKIEKKTINQNPISSIDQLTRTGTLDAFRVDYYTDLVSKIRASSKVSDFGSIIDGRDALQLAVESSPESFSPLLRRCLQAYAATTYRQYFPNIDNLSAVNDRALSDALDALLIGQLNARNFDRTWAAMPEVLHEEGFGAFVYSKRPSAPRYHDVELSDCLHKYSENGRTFTKGDLERDIVYVRTSSGDTFPRWRVWKCLYSELRHGDDEYVLVDGKWFRVRTEFIRQLDDQIAQIPRNTYDFPAWAQQTREADYLSSLVAAGSAGRLLLDQDLIRLDGQSPIELCDVLLNGTTFVHVKRYGSSDVLSYLFDQGRASARLFLAERRFRAAAQEKCGTAASFPIEDSPNARDYTVAYLIGSKHADAQTLPLFARIVLLDAFIDLRNYGYNVTLGFVPINLA